MERRLAALMAADLAGYSRLMQVDETGTLGRLKSCITDLVEPSISEHRGRVVKHMGDGFIAEFASIVDAVECAVDVQQRMAELNSRSGDQEPLLFRIGINLGDVIVEGDDLFGDGINVASRIEGLADPGGILVSRPVRDQIRDKLDLALEDRGEISVKNIARPVHLFNVAWPGAPASPKRRDRSRLQSAWQRSGRMPAVLAVLLAATVGGALYFQGQQPEAPEINKAEARLDPSIAVLPFENRSGNRNQNYFADGLTDDLITDLSRIAGLSVISRNSVFAYKGQPANIRDIASELEVRYILEGSVRREGDRVRVNTQLVDGNSGRQIWSQRYDRKLVDIFDLQDQVVASIVSELAIKLGAGNTAERRNGPPKFEAYDLYLRAREGFYSRDPQRMRASLDLFRRAWTIDPGFAKAYSGYAQLAQDIGRLGSLRYALGGGPALRSAEVAARKALQIDPTLADAYSVLALISMIDRDHAEALDFARRAVAFEPSNADALTALAIVQLYGGSKNAALETMGAAARLNPWPQPYFEIYRGLVYFMNGKNAEAVEILTPIADADIRSMGDAPREILAMAYSAQDQTENAREQVGKLLTSEPFLNLSYYKVLYAHHASAEDLEVRIDALREAGMPEWPFGYTEAADSQLEEEAIREIIQFRRWRGEDVGRRSSFIKELGANGNVSYATSNMILNGSATVEDGWLCERFDGFILGRKLCGPVFSNRTSERSEPYTYVNPATVVHFNVEQP